MNYEIRTGLSGQVDTRSLPKHVRGIAVARQSFILHILPQISTHFVIRNMNAINANRINCVDCRECIDSNGRLSILREQIDKSNLAYTNKHSKERRRHKKAKSSREALGRLCVTRSDARMGISQICAFAVYV